MDIGLPGMKSEIRKDNHTGPPKQAMRWEDLDIREIELKARRAHDEQLGVDSSAFWREIDEHYKDEREPVCFDGKQIAKEVLDAAKVTDKERRDFKRF